MSLRLKEHSNNKEKYIYVYFFFIKADVIVEDKIIIEIKAISKLASQHEAQLINYLKATGIKLGLLADFGEKLEFKRRIF